MRLIFLGEKFRIIIVEAKGLLIKGDDGSCDSYAVIEHDMEQRYETSVVTKTNNPEWNEAITM